jgi:hypothetical protein
MFTCGWRRSSVSAKATRSSTMLVGAVMLTLLVTSSAETFPRPTQVPLPEPDELGALAMVGCAGGGPATGGWPAAADEEVLPAELLFYDGMHCRRRWRIWSPMAVARW